MGARFVCVLAVTIICCFSSFAQGYWQQEVNYLADITLAEDLRTITGWIDIEYHNNSPDTLHVIYLKAFPNAIQKNSYADLKQRTHNDYSFASLKPEEEGSLVLRNRSGVVRNDLPYRSIETDNTIITVVLAQPLAPGSHVTLPFDFTTILPEPASMRMGLTRGTTKAAYWFPQACVYDRKYGWVNAQYLGWAECYGDFGYFDVMITAPEDQIVAATGILVNREEVLPDSLRELLDIKNYLRPRREWPELHLDGGQTKTWHYRAEDVNDFAWTSSNSFCIDSGSVNGVKVVAYPLRHKAGQWTEAVEIGKQAIETFSELYYPYQWPVIRICDAYSGMEFPMLTNCSGGPPRPSFWMLLYHEIGHQWFMGQVGSSQVDRPFLDEGFTTHMEHNIMEKYLGPHGNYHHHTGWYEKLFAPPLDDRNVRGFRPLLLLMKEDFDKPMAVSYDRGEEYWPYRVSMYYKCAAMHYSLRSILGDSLYFRAMHHYCDRWFFKHPYEEDFTRAMEEATGLDMDAYLQQWYYHRYRVDYAYAGRSSRRNKRSYEHTIKLKRKGKLVSPIDVAVIWEQGDTAFYTVPPEGMAYAKPGFGLLPTWHQFRRLNDEYSFTLTAGRTIKKVVVDPYNLLMDIDRMNNQSGWIPPIELRLDNMLYDRTPVNRYALRLRPDLWFDDPNGVQVGMHAHGSYLEVEHRFSLDLRVGTKSSRPFINAVYASPFKPFGAHSSFTYKYLRADRRDFMSSVFEKKFRHWYSRPDHELFRLEMDYFDISGKQGNRLDPFPTDRLEFLPDRTWDATATYYAVLTTGFLRTFRYGDYRYTSVVTLGGYSEDGRRRAFTHYQFIGDLTLNRGSSTPWCRLRLEVLGTNGEPPTHFLHHLSRVGSLDRFLGSPIFRTPGTFPIDWENDFYLANRRVRGYQDRNIPLTEAYAASLELTPPDWLPYRWLRFLPLAGRWLSGTDNALFVDFARVSLDNKGKFYPQPVAGSETGILGDEDVDYVSAGISLCLPPVWKGQKVRFDFPLYLSKPAPGEDEFDFRFSAAWLLPLD